MPCCCYCSYVLCADPAGMLPSDCEPAAAAAAVLYGVLAAQAQGLCQPMGGRDALVGAVQQHGTVLAAHGPYTAAGASEVLGLPVPVVSKNFSTFHGLVAALAEVL